MLEMLKSNLLDGESHFGETTSSKQDGVQCREKCVLCGALPALVNTSHYNSVSRNTL
jgi:hypothetical protein